MAWELLFTSDIGLLSLFTIAFILVMGWYIAGYAARHMKSDAESSRNNPSRPAVH
ncbi:MAG: DUF3149 domain-containing protein [Azonexaceae bacterium]|jgi:hypothetical protein|uniref:DUF3149 domain-containing protein n=1 Tax=Azonexus sp. R2A61 TaxID=2744443 RepID=UPI001F382E7C|nr:DUF3149 domain-containing protein [Azonexus sp. R2A61]MCE1240119.1 DUF3149 domain-containing protein [Azonexaceae bacterium]